MTEEETACIGKTRFERRKKAKQRANQIRRHTGNRMRPYRCPYCGWIHLGHRPGEATYIHSGGYRLQETTT